MDSNSNKHDDAWELLSSKLTDSRREKMEWVARHRTKHVRLVLQDVHDPHNVSACIRSAEAMGILHIDLVNLYQKFAKPSSVARGSANWLEIGKFRDLKSYVQMRREEGYRFAIAYPSPDCPTLDDLPVDGPLAIVFGNEHQGVHSDWNQIVDYRFTIPMVGMVESLNISVSAALTMYSLTRRMLNQRGERDYFLSQEEQLQVLNLWMKRHSRNLEEELSKLRSRKV